MIIDSKQWCTSLIWWAAGGRGRPNKPISARARTKCSQRHLLWFGRPPNTISSWSPPQLSSSRFRQPARIGNARCSFLPPVLASLLQPAACSERSVSRKFIGEELLHEAHVTIDLPEFIREIDLRNGWTNHEQKMVDAACRLARARHLRPMLLCGCAQASCVGF
jgi:hypothetical protein